MLDTAPVAGSLVLYKTRPALVTGVEEKIDILFENKSRKRVRPKDILLLHPGPLTSLAELRPLGADPLEAWELISGGATDLGELAELIYGEYSPGSAWAAWQLVADGLYFEGTPLNITARSESLVATDIAQREARATAEREWEAFLQRLGAGSLESQDRKRLQEVEAVALGKSDQSKVLDGLGIAVNPVSAHRMLVACGYWPEVHDPYPGRAGLPQENPVYPLPPLPDEERLDLTHLAAFAIDDEGSEDPDDAVSLDADRIWVHVADVAALVTPDSALDLEARVRGANLYLPEGIVHMLPPVLTQVLGLGLQSRSPALSFGFSLDADSRVVDFEVAASWIRVERRRYTEVNQALDQAPFDRLLRLAQAYRQRRQRQGAASIDLPEVSIRVGTDGAIDIRPLQRIDSRVMVTELMLMAGEGVAAYALARDIPLPFATQPPPEELRHPEGMAAMYAYRRLMRPSRSSTLEEAHAGLGLAAYVRVTSPLRRYLDLVAHQQLRAHLAGEGLLTPADLTPRIGAADQVSGSIRRTERLANLHWKLLYLKRNPGWTGQGVVVELQDTRATVIIPELALETKIRVKSGIGLDRELKLALGEVDVADQTARFRIVKS